MPFLIPCILGVAGCGSSLDSASSAALSVRDASERAADRNDDANRVREAKILADGQAMIEKAKGANDMPDGSHPRYEIRKDNVGDSWTVYDTANGRAVRIDSKSQAGLSHEQADAVMTKLVQQEKQQDQLFGRVRP
jgi:hypothetical protein